MLLLNNFIQIFIESASWLMLGLIIAGLMKAFVPEDLLARHLGQPGFPSIIKAALLGAPLPLCSCGVIPAAVGLRRNGASKAATTSFLISTPETGVDSISISYALLGPFMTIIRPIAAIVSAITAGILVGKDDEESMQEIHSDSCCASKQTVVEDSCCSTQKNNADKPLERIRRGLIFTLFDLVKDISIWLVIGLAFAALIKTYVPNEFLTQWGDGLLAFTVMALLGVPMYICATASTPIAAGLLFSGVSPGAVLVFMLVGPATNIATLGLVRRELGKRALTAYLIGVIGIGFIFGVITNYLARSYQIDFINQAQHHHLTNSYTANISAVFLAILMIYALLKKYLFTEKA